MIRKLSALLAAFALAFTTLAPVSVAEARDRHGGYYDRGHHRDYDHRRWRHRDRDHGDAVAAGAVGLILGLAIGSLASQPRQSSCYDNYQRCAPPPPPPCRNPCGYDRDSYYDPRYDDPRYDDGGSAYERDYDYDPSYDGPREQCMRQERQWDRYANRYVTVDVPC
jgi:hypothetical protein